MLLNICSSQTGDYIKGIQPRLLVDLSITVKKMHLNEKKKKKSGAPVQQCNSKSQLKHLIHYILTSFLIGGQWDTSSQPEANTNIHVSPAQMEVQYSTSSKSVKTSNFQPSPAAFTSGFREATPPHPFAFICACSLSFQVH